MKKFTVLGDGDEYGQIAAHIVAVDKEAALKVARAIYQGPNCGWMMFPNHLVDVEDQGSYETPDKFCKRCLEELHNPKPKTMRKVEFLTAISDYLHWYNDNCDQIKLFLTEASVAPPDEPPYFPIMTDTDDDGGTPRMRPWTPPFGGPRKPVLDLSSQTADWEALRNEIIDNGGVRNASMIVRMPGPYDSTVSVLGATSPGIYPERKLTLGRQQEVVDPLCDVPNELKEPEIHVEKEAPQRPRHLWIVQRGGTAVGIQLRKDGEIVTNRYQTITECLQAFSVTYPGQDLMIHGDNDMFVWFKMDKSSVIEPNQVSIHAYGHPALRTEEELVRFVKSLNIYQFFAIALAHPNPQEALVSFIRMIEEKVCDKNRPVPQIPVMIEPSVKTLTADRVGYRALTIEQDPCPYVVTSHYPAGLGTATQVRTAYFNSLYSAMSSLAVNPQERLVVHKATDSNVIVWLQYNDYHKCPSVHYWNSPTDKPRDEVILETYSILQFVRSLEIVRRLAIFNEIIRNRDLK
jgi:hypothetical protein